MDIDYQQPVPALHQDILREVFDFYALDKPEDRDASYQANLSNYARVCRSWYQVCYFSCFSEMMADYQTARSTMSLAPSRRRAVQNSRVLCSGDCYRSQKEFGTFASCTNATCYHNSGCGALASKRLSLPKHQED